MKIEIRLLRMARELRDPTDPPRLRRIPGINEVAQVGDVEVSPCSRNYFVFAAVE